MHWLDRLSYPPLVIATLLLGLAPFRAQPHLWEKLQMLIAGTLERPVDIFDLVLHGAPLTVLALKLGNDLLRRRRTV